MNRDEFSWGTCDGCGGDLPMIDGDNGHRDLPPSQTTDGDCPGRRSGRYCGCYSAKTVDAWLEDNGYDQ